MRNALVDGAAASVDPTSAMGMTCSTEQVCVDDDDDEFGPMASDSECVNIEWLCHLEASPSRVNATASRPLDLASRLDMPELVNATEPVGSYDRLWASVFGESVWDVVAGFGSINAVWSRSGAMISTAPVSLELIDVSEVFVMTVAGAPANAIDPVAADREVATSRLEERNSKLAIPLALSVCFAFLALAVVAIVALKALSARTAESETPPSADHEMTQI